MMSRYARRKDRNHSEIIAVLRGIGAHVEETYRHPGMLDCIVGWRGQLYWADVKHGNAELTATERELIANFARVGVTLYVWRTPDEALRTIGVLPC